MSQSDLGNSAFTYFHDQDRPSRALPCGSAGRDGRHLLDDQAVAVPGRLAKTVGTNGIETTVTSTALYGLKRIALANVNARL